MTRWLVLWREKESSKEFDSSFRTDSEYQARRVFEEKARWFWPVSLFSNGGLVATTDHKEKPPMK